MAGRRVVVAAPSRVDPDVDPTVSASRALWREGWEVIHLGGGVSVEAIVSTAVPEDASQIVVLGSAADVTSIRAALDDRGETEVTVRSAR